MIMLNEDIEQLRIEVLKKTLTTLGDIMQGKKLKTTDKIDTEDRVMAAKVFDSLNDTLCKMSAISEVVNDAQKHGKKADKLMGQLEDLMKDKDTEI